jgi:ribonucleoside-diphosphate reductase alpha chain
VRGSVVGRVLPRSIEAASSITTRHQEATSAVGGGTVASPSLYSRHTSEPAMTGLTTEGALAVKPRTELDQAVEARLRGYEGEACRECGNFTLVRNGTCLKCDTCGGTSGCS